MKNKIILIFLFLSVTISGYSQLINWVSEIKGGGKAIRRLRVTPQGDIFITGNIEALPNSSFGNITIPSNHDVHDYYFMAKCSKSGNFEWVKYGGGWYFNSGADSDIDQNGNVYTTGLVDGNATFDSITLNNNTNNYVRTFLLKYDPSGNIKWGRRFGTDGGGGWGGNCLRYLNDNLYVFSSSWGSNTISVFNDTLFFNSVGMMLYCSKFDTSGNYIGVNKIAESQSASLNLVEAIPVDDNFIITGYADASFFVDTNYYQNIYSRYQSFLAKYNSNGNFLWNKKFSSSNWDNLILGITVDGDKNILATGVYYDTLNIDGTILIDTSSNDAKSFLCKLDSSGNLLWIKDINGWGDIGNIGIAQNNSNIYLTGYFNGYLHVDTLSMSSPYNYNLSILEFDTSGNIVNGQTLGNPQNYIRSNGIGIDEKGQLYIAGLHLNMAQLQNYILNDNNSSWGIMDGFIFKYHPTRASPPAMFVSSDSLLCSNSNNCISFYDKSLGASSWEWYFPGANPDHSNDKNPNNICYDSVGNYPVTLIAANSFGSDTLEVSNMITFNKSPNFRLHQHDNVLYCVGESSYKYQWYFNDSIIPEANDSFYVVNKCGNYFVSATDNNACTYKSDAVLFPAIGEWKIFPNPAQRELFLNTIFAPCNRNYSLTIYNAMGETILEKKLNFPDYDRINIERLSSGIYFVHVYSDKEQKTLKFIKL